MTITTFTRSVLAALTLTLTLTTGCGSIPNAPPSSSASAPAVVRVADTDAPHAAASEREVGPGTLPPRERRIMRALRNAFPDARQVTVDAPAPDEGLLSALKRAGIVVVDASSPESREGKVVHVVLASDRAQARARSKRGNYRIVTWTEDSANVPFREGGMHVSTPIDVDGQPRRFEHLVVAPSMPDLPARLAAADLWPAMPALEIVRMHEDGSRDVRVLGYVNADADEPERHLSTSGVAMVARLSTPPELTPRFRSAARSARGKVAGPTLSLLFEEQDRRRHTMIDAVGTCGNGWVSGAAVAVTGRARLRVDANGRDVALDVDVTGVESTLAVSKWLTLAGPYREAVTAVTRALVRRGTVSTADYAPLARVHERIRVVYGVSASLLEVDAMLGQLEQAFRDGSAEEALHALELRCRATAEEKKLADSLRPLARGE